MKAVKAEEIILATDNKMGRLEEIAGIIKTSGINIRAISAWGVEDKAFFRLITSDNKKTKEVLSNLGSIESKDVVIVEMPDEVGQLHALGKKLKDASIDLTHVYGTTSEPGKSAIIVFSSNNNEKAIEVVSA